MQPGAFSGWDQHCNETAACMDVRAIQAALKQSGLTFASEADVATRGPASLLVIDPDGNPVLIDRHRWRLHGNAPWRQRPSGT